MGGWPLEWRPRALPELASVVGATFQDLAISSCLLTTQNVDHDVSAVWLTTGLWIGTESVGSTSSMRSMRMALGAAAVRDDEHDWRSL